MFNNLLSAIIQLAPDKRGILIFGFEIYFYAIIITSGMIAAIIVMSRLLKKKGLPPDQSLDYAILVIPFAILGCRIYFLLFPYSNISYDQFLRNWTWSNFWDIRDGGLGIYGGVILGYITGFVLCRIKKQKFYEIADCIMPGLLLAQSIGRWGNFMNGEAFGNLVSNPDLQFFPYAVLVHGEWYQATFFYESVFTFLGFIMCLLLLRNKNYRDGLLLCFYGIYYGAVRLFIEGLRADSLYLRVPIFWKHEFWETGIRISQAVSIIIIVFAIIRFIYIYRDKIKDFFNKNKNKKKPMEV